MLRVPLRPGLRGSGLYNVTGFPGQTFYAHGNDSGCGEQCGEKEERNRAQIFHCTSSPPVKLVMSSFESRSRTVRAPRAAFPATAAVNETPGVLSVEVMD